MLKKSMVALLVTVFLLTVAVVPAMAGDYSYLRQVELVVGQKNATIDGSPSAMDQAAYVKNGRTLVPFRFLGEALGAQIGWDNKTNTATLTLKGSEVKVTIKSKTAYINGKKTSLDVAAETKGGRTFVPVRFVSEALGADVQYDDETQTITISLVDPTGWKEWKLPVLGNILSYPPDWTVNEAAYKLDLTSPLGSRMVISVVDEDPAKIVADKKTALVSEGFQVIAEGLIDKAYPERGSSLIMGKINFQNPDDSDFHFIFVIKEGEGIISLEMTTKLAASKKDMPVLGKVLSSGEE